jgi:hypothetical protein
MEEDTLFLVHIHAIIYTVGLYWKRNDHKRI